MNLKTRPPRRGGLRGREKKRRVFLAVPVFPSSFTVVFFTVERRKCAAPFPFLLALILDNRPGKEEE